MRAGLFVLPFLALLVGAMCTAIASAFVELSWVLYAGWASAAVIVILWLTLDFEAFSKLFRRRGAKYGAGSGSIVLLGMAIVVGVCMLTTKPRFNKTYDATRSKLNTLSDQSIKTLDMVKERNLEIGVTAYFKSPQEEMKFRDLFSLYQAKADVFRASFVDSQVDPVAARAAGIEGDTVIFSHAEQEARITTFSEEKITNAMIQVLKEGAKKVYFTTGHGEPALRGADETGHQRWVQALENYRYEVAEVDLLRQAGVPADAAVLVIAGPKYDLKAEEVKFVESYLKAGGSLLVSAGPTVNIDRLNGLMAKFGLKFNYDYILRSPVDRLTQYLGREAGFITEFDELNPITKDFAVDTKTNVLGYQLRSIAEVASNANNMKVELVAKTAPEMTRFEDVRSVKDIDREQKKETAKGVANIDFASFPVVGVARGKQAVPANVADSKDQSASVDTKSDVSADKVGSGDRETRVVAIGTAVMGANGVIENVPAGLDLLVNSVNFLLKDEDFISIRPRKPEKTSIDLSSAGSQLNLLFIAFIYPFMFLGGGVVTWLRRRRA